MFNSLLTLTPIYYLRGILLLTFASQPNWMVGRRALPSLLAGGAEISTHGRARMLIVYSH